MLFGFVAAGCTTAPSNTGASSGPGEAVVQRVVDGDTIVVSIAGRDERVRLIGVDTPESVDPRKPVQCFGKEASAFTTQLLPPGTVVRLERDVEARDRFDRLLAYVYRVSDGLFVNFELARAGYATAAHDPAQRRVRGGVPGGRGRGAPGRQWVVERLPRRLTESPVRDALPWAPVSSETWQPWPSGSATGPMTAC